MASAREVREHIKSVKDTEKITNAMYLISSTKYRKIRGDIDYLVSYCNELSLQMEMALEDGIDNVLAKPNNSEGGRAFIVITADKGLAGAYNHNVLRLAEKEIDFEKDKAFTIGEFGRRFFEKKKEVFPEHLGSLKDPDAAAAEELAGKMCEIFLRGDVKEVNIIFTRHRKHGDPEVVTKKVLPLESFDKNPDVIINKITEYVPDKKSVMDVLVPKYINMTFLMALFESFFCEQSMRMNAMDSANDNASELIEKLDREYHHLRQDAITSEITEVSAGAKAKKGK